MSPLRSVYDLSRAELGAVVAELGEPAYRAGQIWRWLYVGFAERWADMTDLPQPFRAQLEGVLALHTVAPVTRNDTDDGLAAKWLIRLADGQLIETVLMHYLDPADGAADSDRPPSGRHTVCLSTQVGCAMGCVFCATGQMGLMRNLTRAECVEQLVLCARTLAADGARLSNVVFMGMGEPLANWPGTWGAVETLTDSAGWGLSPRRLTISTVGIVPAIRRLAASDRPVRLAVSIHAPDDALRRQLVPVNDVYPLDEIFAACRDYQAVTGRRITFEYVLIAGVNDHPAQARALARRLAGFQAHVNVIPLNPTEGSSLATPTNRDAMAFQRALELAGVPTTLRLRRGIDIRAGCGQLRSRAAEGLLGRRLPIVPAATPAAVPPSGRRSTRKTPA